MNAPTARTRRKRSKTRVERGTITADQIVAGALELAETLGIDGITMQKLAQHLGYGETSLYWYFRNKRELIAAMTVEASRRFYAKVRSPADVGWDTWVLESTSRLWKAMHDDPVGCELLFLRPSMASELAFIEHLPVATTGMEKMVDAGFSPEEALQNLHIISLYTHGCIVRERPLGRAEERRPAPVASAPHLASAPSDLRYLFGVSDETFLAELALLVDGMRARLAARTR